jgi:hypothetical protein
VRLTRPPFVLPGDECLLGRPTLSVVHRSWNRFIRDRHFGERDYRFHLGLLPQPYAGDPASASVVILSLNPGLSPADYFGEFRVPEFRRALLANLRQRRESSAFPNLWLDPLFSWHSGFKYWHEKLRKVIDRLAERHSVARSEALRLVSGRVASLELYPYHSARFDMPSSLAQQLWSAKLARSFAHDVLLPRVRSGKAIIVITRHASAWGLSPRRGIIVYGRGESRGAHLTPNSRGGRAILRQLARAGA